MNKNLLPWFEGAALRLSYDASTGALTWLPRTGMAWWNERHAGTAAACLDQSGYVQVRMSVNGWVRVERGHRLAWFITHGVLPSGEIDHINRVKHDNRLSNLRDVNRAVNARNVSARADCTSGIPGVSWDSNSGMWRGQVNFNRRRHCVGYFADKAAAASAVACLRATLESEVQP